MHKSKSGFTLIELLIVIGIIAILTSITVVIYGGINGRARDDQRRTDVKNIQKALELYYADNGAYPIPSGTSSVISSGWYTSGDSSWTTFANTLVGSNAIDALPKDPVNSSGNPFTANTYVYSYFTGGYCGKNSGEWYILVYRLEGGPKEKISTGGCSTNPLGDDYYDTYGMSYARVTR